MKTYLVEWCINLDGETPLEVAEIALDIQRDPESVATVFFVTDPDTGRRYRVDPMEGYAVDVRFVKKDKGGE